MNWPGSRAFSARPSPGWSTAWLEAGLIERREDPEDRRSALLSVSEEGHSYLEAHRSRKSAWLANLIEEMPEEDAETLARAAEILSQALEGHRTAEVVIPDPTGADAPEES